MRRIKVSKECIISACSEVIVHGQLEAPQLKHYALVRAGDENVCDKLMVGKCLVKSDKSVCPVRIMNLLEKEITLPAGQYIGQAEAVDVLSNEDNTSTLLPSLSPPTLIHDLPGHIRDLFEET